MKEEKKREKKRELKERDEKGETCKVGVITLFFNKE
jgi:hypothetical protein